MLVSGVVLAVLLVVGGTMAWFTSTPAAVENTFTAGTVDIDLLENGEVYENGLQFTNVNPGDSYAKKVEVRNNGSKQTYVRVKVDYLWTLINPPEGFDEDELNVAEIDFNTAKWIDGEDGYYYYKDIVKTTGNLEPLFNTVTFKGLEMGNEYQGSTFKITLKAEAVQASHEAYKDVWGLNALPTGMEVWAPSAE